MAPRKKTTDDPATTLEEWRVQINFGSMLESIDHAARVLDRPELIGIEYPTETSDRKKKGEAIRKLITDALENVSNASGYVLSDDPEPLFASVRAKIEIDKKTGEPLEKLPKKEAVRRFLGTDPDAREIVLSEAELVDAALRAARVLGRTDLNLDALLRDGLRKSCQELVTRAATLSNHVDPKRALATTPGLNWDHYEKVLNELRAELGTPSWRYRKDEITVSILSRRAGTNDNQIRRWIAAKGITDVVDPKANPLDLED